ncbi:unnamed protein product [Vitrella brassicaformis CCMP3155]|uniref:Uncharacterized protein n=1 Tax=Vitrella brassicaformis (strain CCMP3155) TaxID=1169540 RepID=A0A0G4EDW4_VITBC|nr:unnamed protein product [Vitrella brassicaformis CCMP3155]|eukprot:CEL94155.1 unnamed protein product [Vitrella brassicaformis CCMP3155]
MYYALPSPTNSSASSVCGFETEYHAAPAHGQMSGAALLDFIEALGWTDPLQQQELVNAMTTFRGRLTPVTGSSSTLRSAFEEVDDVEIFGISEDELAEDKPGEVPSLKISAKLTDKSETQCEAAAKFSWVNPFTWFAACLTPVYC